MAEQISVPPFIDDSSSGPPQTPLDTEGRLSFNEARTIVDSGEGYYTPIDSWDRTLSPMETRTDVVLPIISENQGKQRPSVHHTYFYERHYLNHSAPMRALRHSRLQQTNNPAAHKIYHKHYKGTLMPDGEAAIARAIILNSAGYVPHLGVIIKGDDVTVRELTDQERNRLRKPSVFMLEKSRGDQARVGRFLMEYALRRGFDRAKQAHIERFVELITRKLDKDEELQQQKLRLGLRLANIAISEVVEPVERDYREARRAYALKKGAPTTAWEMVKKLLKEREVDYIPTIENKLLDEYFAVS
ncbi:MAG TPA: hypothetical protein VHC21_00425 [Candidatus Saccharimonadales bacterium]|nr:hypothetical protein [Candidatus Saccharimonadales bacterium]